MIDRLCIIGVGLIGGSLALALKKAGVCREIIGAGRNKERLEKALSLGVVDRFETDYAKAVHMADVVLVAVPLGAMKEVFEQIAPVLNSHTIVTDAGSAKRAIMLKTFCHCAAPSAYCALYGGSARLHCRHAPPADPLVTVQDGQRTLHR